MCSCLRLYSMQIKLFIGGIGQLTFLERKLLLHTYLGFFNVTGHGRSLSFDITQYSNSKAFFRQLKLFCLVLLQVAKCFLLVQIFWVSPKIWLRLVPLQKLLCQHKNQFYWIQIIFSSGKKCLWLAHYVNKFLVWHKKFGLAQTFLQPVKGQSICCLVESITLDQGKI